jgi:hypothetical protein
MPSTGLSRDVLAQFLPNQQAVRAFETMQGDINVTLPTTIEEVALSAAASGNTAAAALAQVEDLAGQLDMVLSGPAPADGDLAGDVDALLAAPALTLGTLSAQNDDDVALTGGRMDGVVIGASARAAASFTTVAVSGQITSSVAGAAPFVVVSSFEVANLRSATATALATARTIGGVAFDGTANITVASATGTFTVGAGFGCNGKTAQGAYSVGAAATDLASALTLVNNLRLALIANGIAV